MPLSVVFNGDGLGSDRYDLASIAEIITVVLGMITDAEGSVKIKGTVGTLGLSTIKPN